MAKKAKAGTGLAAAQKYLGLVQNARGNWVRPGKSLATKTLRTITENMGYQAGGLSGRTPLAAPKTGNRLGFVSNTTGQFSLAGAGGKKRVTPPKSGAKPKRGRKGPFGAGGGGEARDVTSSVETGTTGYAKQYSKSPYRTSDFAIGGGRAEFGKSGTGKKKQSETPRKVKTRQLAKKNKKKK